MDKAAVISDCKKYRYSLFRKWEEGPTVLFVMLNPSTADANIDDPTIRRCIQFAKDNGFGSLYVGNLYAYRATNPKEIMKLGFMDATGEDNEKHLNQMLSVCEKVIVAWGSHGAKGTFQMNQTLRGKDLWCLGKNKSGSPKHPLYLAKSTELQSWEK